MSTSHERIAELLRAQRAEAYAPPPPGSRERLLARLERETSLERGASRSFAAAVASALARSGAPRAAATLALAAAGVLLVALAGARLGRTPADVATREHPSEAATHAPSGGAPPRSLTERLASVSGIEAIGTLARGSRTLLGDELESPIRSELAALAADARRTADSFLADLGAPVERLLGDLVR